MSIRNEELELAARVLDLARAAAGSDAQVEVGVERTALDLTRFANSYIHQNVGETTTRVALRVHADGRTTSATTTITSDDALRALVERTIAATKLSPLDPKWPGLAPVAPLAAEAAAALFDETIVEASPAVRAAQVRAYIDAVEGLTAAGYFRTKHVSAAVANSAGQSVSGEFTEAALDAIAKTATSDGATRQASRRMADIDGAVHGARAAKKARLSADPVEIEPGAYEVVLEPNATTDLLFGLAHAGFDGQMLAEGTSFLKIGEQQFDSSVTLVDDPLTGAGAGLPFDVEGTPRTRLTLVENGVSKAAVYDRRTAAEVGAASTGHGNENSAMWGVSAENIRLEPGAGAPPTEVEGPASDSSVLDLVRGVERGLLVSDHWYTRVLDSRRLVLTGLTRNGVWLIEGGEITRPVQNMRFTQSYPEAMGPGRVLGIGSHAVAQPANWGTESPMAPALRLAEWNFTGGAKG